MKKEKLLLIIAVLAVIFAFVYFSRNTNTPNVSPTEPPVNEEQLNNVLLVSFDEEHEDNFKYQYSDGKTAFDVLQEYSENKGIIIKTKQYDFGVFIEAIGEYENTNEKAWIYYVNEKSGDVSADNHKLEEGDIIEWKYQEPIY